MRNCALSSFILFSSLSHRLISSWFSWHSAFQAALSSCSLFSYMFKRSLCLWRIIFMRFLCLSFNSLVSCLYCALHAFSLVWNLATRSLFSFLIRALSKQAKPNLALKVNTDPSAKLAKCDGELRKNSRVSNIVNPFCLALYQRGNVWK